MNVDIVPWHMLQTIAQILYQTQIATMELEIEL